jgi:hypothetical protein
MTLASRVLAVLRIRHVERAEQCDPLSTEQCRWESVMKNRGKQEAVEDAELAAYQALLRKRRPLGKRPKLLLTLGVVVLAAVCGGWHFWPDAYTYQKMDLGMFGIREIRTDTRTGKTEVYSCDQWQAIEVTQQNVTIPRGTRFCF